MAERFFADLSEDVIRRGSALDELAGLGGLLAQGRRRNFELLGNQHSADAVLDQVSIDLRPETRAGPAATPGSGDALVASESFAAQSGALPIHAFDQSETLFGQGTLGLELEGQVSDLDTLLVPVGGGGLIGGIAAWFERKVRVVAVEPEASPTMYRALTAGRPVDAEAGGIAAESLAPQRIGELVFPIARECVDRVVLVSDDAIRSSQRALWNVIRVVAEPGGAAAFAALLSGRYQTEKLRTRWRRSERRQHGCS
jgi:hypothetical protein